MDSLSQNGIIRFGKMCRAEKNAMVISAIFVHAAVVIYFKQRLQKVFVFGWDNNNNNNNGLRAFAI